MPKLTKRLVESTPPRDRDLILWDSELKGFGLRVKPSGAKSFIVQYRTGQGRKWPTRRVTLGRFGPLTVEQARGRAKLELASVTLGANPRAARDAAAKALTVAELCDEYLRAAQAGSVVTRSGKPKARSTLEIDEGRIARHIKPLVGRKRASELTRSDVRRMYEAIAAGETAANEPSGKLRGRAIVTGGTGTAKKAVTLLRAVLSFALRERLVSENVAADLPLPSDGRRAVEKPEQLFRDLGGAVFVAEQRGEAWQAQYLVWLLALTGMRREEAIGIEWDEIDFKDRALRLKATKTGDSVRPLGWPALRRLHAVRVSQFAPRPLAGPVFPASRRGTGAYGGFPAAWRRIVSSPDLDEAVRDRLAPFTPHHLRHAMITLADRMGITEATYGKIAGHKSNSVSAGYVTRALDEALLAVTDRLTERIAELMAEGAAQEQERQLARRLEQEPCDISEIVIFEPVAWR